MQSQFGYQPPIILLKDGTDTSQGTGQLLTNISAALGLCDIVRTTLGPRGMDKLITDSEGKRTISNDGATIVKCLDVVHPAARILADIAESQDKEVGDGTTSVLVLCGGILKAMKPLIEDGMHPKVAIRGLKMALNFALNHLEKISIKLPSEGESEEAAKLKRSRLLTLAGTAMNSKLIAQCKDHFSEIAVSAVEALVGEKGKADADPALIGIKSELGGSLEDSVLVHGVCFRKTFSYAGFEQLPKKIQKPRIILLNIELEWKAERSNAVVRVEGDNAAKEFQSVVEAEFRIIYDKLERIVAAGANVVLSSLPVGDLATQYFVDKGVFCAGRVASDDIHRLAVLLDVPVLTAVTDINEKAVGVCEVFEEKQLGKERYNFFSFGATHTGACTIVLRGGAEQFIQESERSLHDAIEVVRRTIAHGMSDFVGGGGAVEMNVGTALRQYARGIEGKQQLVMLAVADALRDIPRQLAHNAGFDATEVLLQLEAAHIKAYREGRLETCWQGVDITREDGITDTVAAGIWEPRLVKASALRSAVEACSLLLGVDNSIVANQEDSRQADQGKQQTAMLKQRMASAGMSGSVAGAGGAIRSFQGHAGK